MNAAGIERGVRERLDNWRLWMVVAYVVLAGVVVFGLTLNARIQHEQTRRTAEARANSVSDVKSCYDRVDTAPDLLALIDAIQTNAENSLKSSQAALELEPNGVLAPVRRASIKRARASISGAQRFKQRIRESTPDASDCDELAERTGLEPRAVRSPS